MIDQQYGNSNPKQLKKKKTQPVLAYKVYLKKEEENQETQPKPLRKAPMEPQRLEDSRSAKQNMPVNKSRRGGASHYQLSGYSKTGRFIGNQSQYYENSNGFSQSFSCLQHEESLNCDSYRGDSGFEKRKQSEAGYGYGKPQWSQIKYVKIEEDRNTPTTNSEDDNNKQLLGFNIQVNGKEILKDVGAFNEAKAKSSQTESHGDSDDQSMATKGIRAESASYSSDGWSLESKMQKENRREGLFFNSVLLAGPRTLNFPIPSL